MGKTYSRVQRGQVYWFNPTKVYGGNLNFTGFNGKEYKSSVQMGNRPWLVISNNEGNASSPTCNIVPITTEEKADIPVHVHFNYEGKRQTLLVEQPKTVDCLALKDYICTLSDDLMEKVEKAIAIQYSVRSTVTYADFNLDNTIQYLETLVSNIISKKMEAQRNQVSPSQIEDAAIQLGQMIEDLVGEDVKPAVNQQPEQKVDSTPVAKKATKPISKPQLPHSCNPDKPNRPVKPVKPNYSGMSAIEKFNARYNMSHPQGTIDKDYGGTQSERAKQTLSCEKDKKSSGKRNTWTVERRKQYLEDCDKMSPAEVQQKYGFTNIQSVFQTKYVCKNALIKAGIIEPDKD